METIRRSAEMQSVAPGDNEYEELSNAAAQNVKTRRDGIIYDELAVMDAQHQIQGCLFTSCPLFSSY